MSKPYLRIFAGCNGSGKSTFSKSYVADGIVPFDYDKNLFEAYSKLRDSELRDVIAKNQTTEKFESSINGAFSNRENFCYETNFDAHPIHWAEKAKELGYYLELYFFCLESQDQAIERVKMRTKRKGHFVANDAIVYKWKEGYKNLNIHFNFFDHVVLVDNSSSQTPIQNLFSITKENGDLRVIQYSKTIPEYAQRRFPNIYKLLSDAT